MSKYQGGNRIKYGNLATLDLFSQKHYPFKVEKNIGKLNDWWKRNCWWIETACLTLAEAKHHKKTVKDVFIIFAMEGVGKIKAVNKDNNILEIWKTNSSNIGMYVFKLNSIMINFKQVIDVLAQLTRAHQKVWITQSKYPRRNRGHILNARRWPLHTRQKSPLAHKHLYDFSMEYVIQQICTKKTTLLCSTFVGA